MKTITFNNSAREFILDAFGKTIDKEGYLVEKSNPSQRVLAQDGTEILAQEFAGIRKGSGIFIKSDLVSLMKLCD